MLIVKWAMGLPGWTLFITGCESCSLTNLYLVGSRYFPMSLNFLDCQAHCHLYGVSFSSFVLAKIVVWKKVFRFGCFGNVLAHIFQGTIQATDVSVSQLEAGVAMSAGHFFMLQ